MGKPTVHSYARFSSLGKQSLGESEARQVENAEAWCKRNKHKLSPLGTDRGLSGFHGTHRKKGKLGLFLELARSGQIPPGDILLIEKVTRLSREGVKTALQKIIFDLIDAGVVIQFISPEMRFDSESINGPLMHVLIALLASAYQESKDKSDYGFSVWKRRRSLARADKKPMTGRLPAWVELKSGKLILIPERAAAVRRVFELAAVGNGYTRIAQLLTKEGFPPFGRRQIKPGMTRSQFSGVWQRLYVRRILDDRRALGEMQPRTTGRKPEGQPIPDYYPAAVTLEQWVKAHHGKLGPDRKRLPRQGKRVNLFVGMLTDQGDGGSYRMHNKGSAARPQLVLVNCKGEDGLAPVRTFPYTIFETAILKCLREVDPAELYPAAERGASRLDVLKAELARTRQEIAQLTVDLSQGYSAAVSAVLRGQEARETALREEVEQEQAKSARPIERDWAEFKDLADTLAEAKDQADARLRLRALLRRRVREITVRIDRRGLDRILRAEVWFHDTPGGRACTIHYCPAVRYRQGRWFAISQAEGTGHERRIFAEGTIAKPG
jgi:DNA invertase Pin-like site-specific DNA recombinase